MFTIYFFNRWMKICKAIDNNIASPYPSSFLAPIYSREERRLFGIFAVSLIYELSTLLTLGIVCAFNVGWERSLLAILFLGLVGIFGGAILYFRGKQ